MHQKEDKANFRTLSDSENGYIGICLSCHEFNFAYKNVLLTFQEQELDEFFAWLNAYREANRKENSFNGLQHIFPSPVQNLFLLYSDDDLRIIQHMYMEAKLMMATGRILSPSTY